MYKTQHTHNMKSTTENLTFVCLPSSKQDTTFIALVVEPVQKKIVDRREGLHDIHAAMDFFKTEYEHDLTVGECFESYFAWRAER